MTADEATQDDAAPEQGPMVKRIEITREGAGREPEVHYARSVGLKGEPDGMVALYQPLWPRTGWVRYVKVATVADLFVVDVPASEVPAVDAEPVATD